MRNSWVYIVSTDSIELLRNKIKALYPDVRQILDYDTSQTGIKSLFFDISSTPLIKAKRAFIIHNLMNRKKENSTRNISIEKNPRGALMYIESIVSDTDPQEFISNEMLRMDNATYTQLGLNKIVPFSQRGRILELLDIDASQEQPEANIESFIKSHSNENNILFIVSSRDDDKSMRESFSSQFSVLNLKKAQKGYGSMQVDPSVQEFVSEYSKAENIRIKEKALYLLCEYTSNNIESIKNELSKLRAILPPGACIEEDHIAEFVKKQATMEWFWLINEIFNTDFLRAYSLIMDVYNGNLSIGESDTNSFIFMLLPQLVTYLHHALMAKGIERQYKISRVSDMSYQHFKAHTLPYLTENMKKDGLWVYEKRFNILSLSPYRVYNLFIWASKYSDRKITDIVNRIAEIDRLLKSTRANVRNYLFDLIAMIYF